MEPRTRQLRCVAIKFLLFALLLLPSVTSAQEPGKFTTAQQLTEYVT